MLTMEGKHFSRRTTIYWAYNISILIKEKSKAYENNVTKLT